MKFADNTRLYKAIRREQYAGQCLLQKDIDKIEQWSRKWQISFNASKCKTMHYGYGNPSRLFKINDKKIES